MVRAKKKIIKTEEKAKHTAVLRKLKPIAKEIMTRLDKAGQHDGKADDHRIAACIRTAEAQDTCKSAGIKFKTFVDDYMSNEYKYMLKLAKIGHADDPKAALADLRKEDAIRQAKSQKRLQSNVAPKRVTHAPEGATPQLPSKLVAVEQSLLALGDKGALNVARNIASQAGMRVVSETDVGELKRLQIASRADIGLTEVKREFDRLSAKDKMALVEYAVKAVGVEIIKPSYGEDDDGLEDERPKVGRLGSAETLPHRPAFLDRGGKKPKVSKKAKKPKVSTKEIKRGVVA